MDILSLLSTQHKDKVLEYRSIAHSLEDFVKDPDSNKNKELMKNIRKTQLVLLYFEYLAEYYYHKYQMIDMHGDITVLYEDM